MRGRTVGLLILLVIVDRLLKQIALQSDTSNYFGGFFILARNPDQAFSLAWPSYIFWPITIILILYCFSQAIKLWHAQQRQFFWWSLIALGAVNNLIDRLLYGGVIDYINLKVWPVFNLSDAMIALGVFFLLGQEWRKNRASKWCTFYLIRHGQTEHNVKNITQGHSDSPLTAEGIRQAIELGQRLKSVKFDAVFSSDLLRAKRTAELITLERHLEVKTRHLLRERSYGRFEGKDWTEYHLLAQEMIKKMASLSAEEKWKFKYAPDIESNHELISRFITCLREIALAYPGGRYWW
ncbi:MAG: histidine phosphatase family protein [Candidatus Komeilibacteria bacterium]